MVKFKIHSTDPSVKDLKISFTAKDFEAGETFLIEKFGFTNLTAIDSCSNSSCSYKYSNNGMLWLVEAVPVPKE